MSRFHSILATALLAVVATQAQSVPMASDSTHGSGNLSSEGTSFLNTLPLNGDEGGELGQVLLTLAFSVSGNLAAQDDTISLLIGGVQMASGKAAGFSVTDLDVTDFYDFATGTLTYELFRGASRGAGNIKLDSSTLRRVSMTGSPPGNDANGRLPTSIEGAIPVPEPGPLALLGFGLLVLAASRRGLPIGRQPVR